MRSRTSSLLPGIKWPYTSKVIEMLACPMKV
jgi:hypothetical protein